MSIARAASRSLRKRAALLALSLGLAPLLLANAAFADAIDGEWCRAGRSFKIDGPEILTYGGTRMRGDYDRHGFRYTVPANEPEAGAAIVMVLRGDELLHLFKKPVAGSGQEDPPEAWQRCRVTS